MLLNKYVLLLLAVAGSALALAACSGDDDGDSIVVYSGRDEAIIAPLLDNFSEQSGIEVEVRYGDSAEMAAAILEEGDVSPATVFFSQDAGALGAIEKEGLFTELPSNILERVPAKFRSADGRWVGVSGRARIVAYNADTVKQNELPSTVDEMYDPKWEGRFGWVPDNASFQAFITAMRELQGDEATEEWLTAMVDNGTRPYPGNSELRDAVAAGEIDAGITNHYYVARAMDENNEDYQGENYPVRIHTTDAADPSALINVAGAGVLSSSDTGAPGEEFIEFLLSDESQEFFAAETKEYPVVPGVAADESLTALDDLDSPDVDLTDLDDLETTLRMIQDSGAL